jgi:phosphoglycerate dehydrogenase-like enzyme
MERRKEPANQEKVVAGASSREARVWIGPAEHPEVLDAVIKAGGTRPASVEDANAIVWCGEGWEDASLKMISEWLHPGIEWVQLDSAGVDDWFRLRIVDEARVWTRADYAPAVAEQVLGFLIAASRRFPQFARATEWDPVFGKNLAGQTVGFLGAGRIVAESILRLKSFGTRILTISQPVAEIDGVAAAYGIERLSEVLGASDHVVVALPLTEQTRRLVNAKALGQMRSTAWLHNVGRGPVVDTDALVAALTRGQIAGACFDTTDPEPLAVDHPLWTFDNVLLTQHTANPESGAVAMYADTIERNVTRFREGAELLGIIKLERGY